MQPLTAARHYDRTTITLHWLMAFLVAEQWLGAQFIDWFPRGPLRVDARSVHIVLGACLAILLIVRLIWRSTKGRRLTLPDHGLLNLLAKAIHWGLYALLIVMVAAGLLLAWTRGDSLFNLFSIPIFDATDRSLSHQAEAVHATVAWIILAVAGLHAAAALVHHYLWHDDVLARMIPRLKP